MMFAIWGEAASVRGLMVQVDVTNNRVNTQKLFMNTTYKGLFSAGKNCCFLLREIIFQMKY